MVRMADPWIVLALTTGAVAVIFCGLVVLVDRWTDV